MLYTYTVLRYTITSKVLVWNLVFFQTVYHVHLPRESDHLRCMTNSFKNSKFFQMPLSMMLLAQVAPPVNEKQVKLTKQE